MTGGFAIFVRGYPVDLKKTIENWGSPPINTGADLDYFLSQTQLLDSRKSLLNEKDNSFLLAMSPNNENFDEAPVEDISLFLGNKSYEFQHWVPQEWKHKFAFDEINQLFDYEALKSPSIKSLKTKWKPLRLSFLDEQPGIHYSSVEWPQYWVWKPHKTLTKTPRKQKAKITKKNVKW